MALNFTDIYGAPQLSDFILEEWDSSVTYAASREVFQVSGTTMTFYQAVRQNTGVDPSTDTTMADWRVINVSGATGRGFATGDGTAVGGTGAVNFTDQSFTPTAGHRVVTFSSATDNTINAEVDFTGVSGGGGAVLLTATDQSVPARGIAIVNDTHQFYNVSTVAQMANNTDITVFTEAKLETRRRWCWG